MAITQDTGKTNQQFFLVNVSLDSCGAGLAVFDSSIITWSGVWACSCQIGINYNPANNAAILNLSGGNIANCGGVPGQNTNVGFSYNNGMGRVQMTGILIWANRGGGFYMGQQAQVPVIITGCNFYDNGGFGNISASPPPEAQQNLFQSANVFS